MSVEIFFKNLTILHFSRLFGRLFILARIRYAIIKIIRRANKDLFVHCSISSVGRVEIPKAIMIINPSIPIKRSRTIPLKILIKGFVILESFHIRKASPVRLDS